MPKDIQITDNSKASLNVESETLIPIQQYSSAMKLQRSANCYFQKFIKFPRIAIFHSYAEYLHAALLEANPLITSFVPQPFRLLVQNRRYIPDCYFVYKSKRYVVELKPRGKFDKKLRKPLKKYFRQHGYNFKVVSNELVRRNEVLALNWHQIVKALLSAEMICTENAELKILDELSIKGPMELGRIIKVGNRLDDYKNEIGVYRLAHKGLVKMELDYSKINYSSLVELCI